MFDRKTQRKLDALHDEIEAIGEKYRRDIKGKDVNQIAELSSDAGFQMDETSDSIAMIVTVFLRRRANQLLVEIPHGEEMWRSPLYVDGGKVLTDKGVATLKERIRTEEQALYTARRNKFELLIQGAVVATGLIGVLIGLVSAFK